VTKLALVGSASGGVSLLGGGTDRVLSLGSGGIESADGAGPLTLGSTVGGQGVPIALTANQTWTNGSASPVTVNNAISAAGVQTLTLRGPGSFRLNGTNTFNGGIITGSGVFLYIGNESALGGGTLTANGGRFYVEDFPLVITNKFKMNNTPLSWWGDGSVTLAGIASSPAVAITVNANQPFTINRTAPTLITGIWSMSDSASGLNNSGVGVTLSSGANVRYTGDIRENNSGNASGVSNYGIYFSFNGAGSDLTLYGNNLYGDGASKGTSINVNAKAGYNSLSIGGPGGPGAVITPLGVATLYSNYGRGIFLKALVSGQCITNNIRMDASTDNDGGMPFGFDGENDLTLGGTILPAKTVNFPNLANATLTVTGGVNCGSVKLTFQGPGHTAFSAPSLLSGTSGGIGKSGPGTLTLAGTSTYLGSTTLYGGTAILDYSEASVSRLAPSTNAASGLTLGGVDLQLKGGSYAQTLGDGAGTTISQGHSRIRRTNGGTSTLALGALTRATNAGGVVDFESGVASTTTGNAVGILGGYGFYTVDNTDWATGGGTISALASYDSFAVPGTDKNILLTGTGSTAGTTVNTLKILTTGSEQSLTITSGTLLLSRSGLLFTGADDYTITGGTLRGRAGYQGDLVVHQNGSGVLTIASSLGNDNNSYFVKAGEGTVVLTYTNNTYIGGTYLLKGVLSVSEEKNLGPGTLTVNGGTLRSTAGFTLSRAISLSSNGGTFDVTTGTLELSGVIASGYGALNKTGPGTLLLTGNNTYNGPTTVTEGTLKLGHDRGLGSASTNANRSVSPVFVKNGATLDIAGCSAYIGNFTLNNGTVADSVGNGVLGAYSFVVNTGLVNVALADVTSPNTANTFNSVNLFKRSSGTVTLTASNLYSGTTFVEAGDLVVNGTLAASPVIVQSAGTLRGTGTLQRTINVEGGTLAPGTSASLPGTLTLGRHLRLDSTATLSIGIGGAGSGKIVLSNPDAKVLLANASLSLSMLPGAVSALTVIDNQGGNPIQGTFSGLPEGATFDAGGRRFAITYSGGDGNDVALTFKPTATLILFN
jgi:autotransporter-associated beta strand protein